jgi:2-aminophenol/2-amino-5-chlorophenol 1,6-dioxygenase alpha subunit
MTSKIKFAAIVPGLPQLNKPQLSSSYRELSEAMTALGDTWRHEGIERIFYYSTQWISVLGQSYQARAALSGLHVDENWYELGDLPFKFTVDRSAAERMAKSAESAGYQTRLVDYDGFPVDTGTIVADGLLNPGGRMKSLMLSCCVYSDYADTVKLAGTALAALADGVPTAAVAVTGLSGRYFTTDIDPREDHINGKADDEWNRKILAKLAAGDVNGARADLPAYGAACKVDMGLKALAFLEGLQVATQGRKATLRAYGALHGTGGAVLSY